MWDDHAYLESLFNNGVILWIEESIDLSRDMSSIFPRSKAHRRNLRCSVPQGTMGAELKPANTEFPDNQRVKQDRKTKTQYKNKQKEDKKWRMNAC